MMPKHSVREELAKIFGALQIHSYAAFSYQDGAPIPTLPAGAPFPSHQDGHGLLLDGIRNHLYGHCYVRDSGVGSTQSVFPGQNLVTLLARANPTMDRWDPGWTLYQIGTGNTILVQKGERSRSALNGEYASNKPGAALQAGDTVNLRVYPGSADLQPGFYFVFSDTLSDQFDEYNLLRFYFNITAEGAPELLREVASRCNRYQVPFRFKTLTDPAGYRRADGAVLYCAKRYFHIVADLLSGLPETVTAQLRPETPLFTKMLKPGIGMAEEPGTGESFGMHRCRLVAEGIIDAWVTGSQSTETRLEAVEKRFAANGLNLDHPYLNSKSMNLFESTVYAGGIIL